MAYDEHLAERISGSLKEKHVSFEAKNMMGGLCYLINGKMAVGIVKNSLMARIDPELYEKALSKKGCRPMDFTGKPMKGYVFVDPAGVDMDKDLEYWIELSLDFNPKAKASKKSTKATRSSKTIEQTKMPSRNSSRGRK
jgi:TfoX/Sxy family transcriptional regulator of competence genes